MFSRLKISTRLQLFSIISLACVLILGVFLLSVMSRIQRMNEEVITAGSVMAELKQREIDHLEWVSNVSAFLSDSTVKTFSVQKDFHKCGFGKWYYGEGSRKAVELVPAIADILQEIERPHSQLHSSVQKLEEILSSGEKSYAAGVGFFKGELQQSLKDVQTHLGELEAEIDKTIDEKTSMAVMIKQKATKTAVALILFSAIILLIICIVIVSSITKPLAQLIGIFKLMTEKNDLTQRLPMRKKTCSEMMDCGSINCPSYAKEVSCWDVTGTNAVEEVKCVAITSGKVKDCNECHVLRTAVSTEIDEISISFNTFVAGVAQLVKVNRDSISVIAKASEEQSATITQIASSTEEMSAQSQNVASTAEMASDNMNSIASSTKEVTESISNVAAAAEEMSATFGEITRNCQKELQIAEKAFSKVKSSQEMMDKLESSAEQIGKVLDIIKKIADQTNLLALNATIEAASAGEAGKGFAVVASEVKELARQTTSATEEIAQQIAQMRNCTSGSVEATELIGGVIEEINTISQVIVSAVEQQSATVQEISRNISTISEKSSKSSLDVQRSAEGMADITGNLAGFNEAISEVAKGTNAVVVSMRELTGMAEKLKFSINKFKV